MIYKSRIPTSHNSRHKVASLSCLNLFVLRCTNLFFISALIFAAAIISNSAIAASTVSERIRFHSLTMEEGLSQSSANTITEDRLGYIWIGTQDGLNRYDGVRFDKLLHSPSDPEGLVSPTINKLLYDSKDTLWAQTPQGVDSIDINSLKINHWTGLIKDLSQASDQHKDNLQIRSISLGEDQQLFVLTDDFIAQIDIVDGSVSRLTQFDALIKSRNVKSILYLKQQIYLLQESCVVASGMDAKSRDDYCLSADLELKELRLNQSNGNEIVVIGDKDGFAIFDIASKTIKHHSVLHTETRSPVRVFQLLTYKGGYWLATADGLKYWDKEAEQVIIDYQADFTDPYSINNDFIQTIWQSSDGLFWIGSLSGVNYWKSKQDFTHLLQKREVMRFKASNYTTSLLKTHDGDFLVGTDSSGIYRYNEDFSILTHYSPLKVGENFVRTGYVAGMVEDRHRNLWIASKSGLFFKPYGEEGFSLLSEVHDTNGKPLDLKDFSAIVEARNGDIWVGGEKRFIQIKINQAADTTSQSYSLEFVDHAHRLPKYLIDAKYGVYTIYEDLQGYLWLGFSKGLARYNPLSESLDIFESVQSNPQTLSNSDITVIYEDLLGVLWIGTVSGLNRVRYNSEGNVYFQRVTESDGFADDFICSILADQSGYLWISTANGLIKYHPDKGVPVNFSYNDGLQHSEFFTNADFGDEEGNLYFGGINGITMLNPNEVSINKEAKELQITLVEQGGDIKSLTREGDTYFANITDKGAVTIRLSTFDYINGKKSDYRYKIDAYEDNWISLDGPTIRLHKLSQEQILIRTQVRQKNGHWGDKEIVLLLRVDKSFWASAQGFMLYLLILSVVVIGIAIYLSRYFLRRLTVQDKKLKERKAQTRLLLSEKKTLLYQVEDLQYSLSEQRYLSDRLENQLENQSVNDLLTGFKSKNYLKQQINQELESISKTWTDNEGIAGIYLGVFAVDIDNLAMINKEHGHLCGNEVLKQAADCLRTISYGSDTLVRWQGATLLVLSRGIEKREQMILAEKIRSIIASRKFDLGNGASIDVTCSVGFGRFPFLGDAKEVITWEQLIYVITRALTVAKNNSRNAWIGIYTNQFSHPQEIRAQITTNLSGLLASGQLDYVSSIPKSNKINWDLG